MTLLLLPREITEIKHKLLGIVSKFGCLRDAADIILSEYKNQPVFSLSRSISSLGDGNDTIYIIWTEDGEIISIIDISTKIGDETFTKFIEERRRFVPV